MRPDAQVRRAFLLTYNPVLWTFDPVDIEVIIDATTAGRTVDDRWATGGRSTGISPDDRLFLLRQGVEPRGIIGSALASSPIYPEPHWRREGGMANYLDLRWDAFVDPDEPLPFAVLRQEMPDQHWSPKGSGTQIRSAVVDELEQLWVEHLRSRAHDRPRSRTS